MTCYKNRSEESGLKMVLESWSSALAAYHPSRVSRSSTDSGPNSMDSPYYRTGSRPSIATDGFFRLDADGDTSMLLEETQRPMESIGSCCVCKCGHSRFEVSNPYRFRPQLGYLPEVDEEMSEPIPHSYRGSSSSPSDEEYSFMYPHSGKDTRSGTPVNNLQFNFSGPSSVGMRSSVGVPYFSSNMDAESQRPNIDKETFMDSFSSHCTLRSRHCDGRRMLLYAPEKYRRCDREAFRTYNASRFALPDSMYNCYNLQREAGTQASAFDVHFRNHQDVLVPRNLQRSQAVPSPPELASSSSISASSDENEHPQIKVGLYKTELCRSWEETGYCRYASKCQFAHGNEDLRPVPRHPKYKTEVCQPSCPTSLSPYIPQGGNDHVKTSICSCAGPTAKPAFAATASGVALSTAPIPDPIQPPRKLWHVQVLQTRKAQEDCPFFNSYVALVSSLHDKPEMLTCPTCGACESRELEKLFEFYERYVCIYFTIRPYLHEKHHPQSENHSTKYEFRLMSVLFVNPNLRS